MPAFLVSFVSPHRLSYIREANLGGREPGFFLPLTRDRLATLEHMRAVDSNEAV